MPGVSCKALATQNSSEWPCSMCPIPPGSGLWGWGHPIHIFLIFPGHPESCTPLQIPSWGPPLGCTLLQFHPVTYDNSFQMTNKICLASMIRLALIAYWNTFQMYLSIHILEGHKYYQIVILLKMISNEMCSNSRWL